MSPRRLGAWGVVWAVSLGLLPARSAWAGGAALDVPQAPSGSWPTFKGGNARTGLGPDLELPVTRVWSTHLKGSLYSSPVIQNGLAVLGSSSGRVYGLALSTGTVRWDRLLPDRVWGSAPALAGGRAYIGCVDGCVYALALADGSVRGTYCSPRHAWFGFGGGDILSPILAEGSRLIFGSDDHSIYAMNVSGGVAWTVATGEKLHDNGAAEEAGLVVMASRDSVVYGLALADGQTRWTYKAGGAFNTVPALDSERAYLGCVNGRLYALSLSDGVPAWTFDTGKGIMSSPALGPDGSVVFGSSDGAVYCLSASTGALRWAFRTGAYVLASPLITGALVWIGSYDGTFYALDLKTGKPRWSMRVGGGVFAAPATADGRVLVAGRDGDLVCLQASAP